MPGTTNLKQDAPLWGKHVTQWHDSGLTQAAYCWDHALCPQSLSLRKWFKLRIELE